MPLQAVLDEGAHGALDESLKTLYVQNSDTKQFWLDIPQSEIEKIAVDLNTKLANKKTELSKVHGEKGDVAKKLKAYEELGKTAEEIKAALESNRPEAVTELIEKHRTEMETLKASFETPIKEATERATKLEDQVRRSVEQAYINKMVATYDLDPETAPAILRDYVRATANEDGDYVPAIYENGQPAVVAGQPMTDEQLIKNWREGKKYQRMFLTPGGGGSGTNPNQQGGKGIKKTATRAELAEMSPDAKREFYLNGGEQVGQ